MKINNISKQELFLRQEKRKKRIISSIRFLLLFSFLFLWEISAQCKWIDPFFFSSPSRIVRLTYTLFKNGELLEHIKITLAETVISFLLVTVISLLSASLLWFFHELSQIFEPFLVVLNSLPKSALAPLFIVWLGTGMKTIIVAGISVAIFGSVLSFYHSFSLCDPDKLVLIRTLNGNRFQAFFKVVLPGALPSLLSASKVNIGLALVGVIIGEFLASREGLGYLIIYGSQVFLLNQVITSIIILCVIAFILYEILQLSENKIQKSLTGKP